MNKSLIVSALNLKLKKLLEKYGELYFDIMTGNAVEQLNGFSVGTVQQLSKVEGEIGIISGEIDGLNGEILEEVIKKDHEEFEALKVKVAALSENIDVDSGDKNE